MSDDRASSRPKEGNLGAAKKREIFDKIKSAVKRAQIFRQIPVKVKTLVFKGDGDGVGNFIPYRYSEGEGLVGSLAAGDYVPKSGESVIVNFTLDNDKFFFQTKIEFVEGRVILKSADLLYQLQRRAHMRIDLSEDVERSVNVLQQNNRTIFVDGYCLDLSAGGAKLMFTNGQIKLTPSDLLRVSFHLRNKWKFEATGLVRFCQETPNLQDMGAPIVQTCGFQFDLTNRTLVSKLNMIMLEMQRWAVSLLSQEGAGDESGEGT